MKDITITAKQRKQEIISIIVCFLLANLLNIIAIIKYNTEWKELWTMFGYVLVITAVFYAVWCAIRIAWCLIKSLYKRIAR